MTQAKICKYKTKTMHTCKKTPQQSPPWQDNFTVLVQTTDLQTVGPLKNGRRWLMKEQWGDFFQLCPYVLILHILYGILFPGRVGGSTDWNKC